jgi:hypothetical protein
MSKKSARFCVAALTLAGIGSSLHAQVPGYPKKIGKWYISVGSSGCGASWDPENGSWQEIKVTFFRKYVDLSLYHKSNPIMVNNMNFPFSVTFGKNYTYKSSDSYSLSGAPGFISAKFLLTANSTIGIIDGLADNQSLSYWAKGVYIGTIQYGNALPAMVELFKCQTSWWRRSGIR